MGRGRKRKKSENSQIAEVNQEPPSRSASSSSDREFIVIDNQNYTKGELQSYVSELKANAEIQSEKITELSAMVEKLNSTVQNLVQKQNGNQNTVSNESEQTTATPIATNEPIQTHIDLSNGATIQDDDESDMDTQSHISELLYTTKSIEQISNSILNSEWDSLVQRNRVLLSAGDERRGHTDSTVGQNRIVNKSKEQSSADRTNTRSAESNSDAGGNNIIMVSKPQSSNEIAFSKKFKVDKKKSPEIIVFNMGNKKQTLTHLKSLLGHDRVMFRAINKDKTAITTENNVDRKKILDFLNSNYSRYFTYTPSDEKPLNFLIKYIDDSFGEEDIKNDLLLLDSEVKILKLKVFGTTKPLIGKNIWLLQTANNEKVKSILGTQKICCSIVKIEIMKQNGVLQCKRCQRFEHAASNCHNTYRCVKCGKEENQTDSNGTIIGHKHGECPLNQTKIDGTVSSENLFCCNCKKSGHSANYSKCDKYMEQIAKKNSKLELKEEKKKMFNNYVNSGQLFVDQIKSNPAHSKATPSTDKPKGSTQNKKSTQPQKSVSFSNTMPSKSKNSSDTVNNNFIQSECVKYFGEDLFGILAKINSFVPEYKKVDVSQKPFKLLEFLLDLSSQNVQ